jgi:hypothetical protein
MNRLVLIGNGFDLAHGLNTKYEHFIDWYWDCRFNSLRKCFTSVSKAALCDVTVSGFPAWYSFFEQGPSVLHEKSGAKLFLELCQRGICRPSMASLFERIHISIETKGWVDIENDYYSLLIQEKMDYKEGFILPDYRNLNNQLDILKTQLIHYLKIESERATIAFNEIEDKIYRPIRKREVALASKGKMNYRNSEVNSISKIMLLNFNYTRTPELYTTNRTNVSINYIHGRIDIPDSVIFGYGDELDSGFPKLKDLNINECLRNIKSIRYLESDNYRKMLEFIESAPFQICIMGHSCGNSDRTLLNTLFEHRNCVSVKPYYYIDKDGKDNYLDLVQNISRNFTDMKLMRDRVVNKTYCEPLTNRNNI